MLHGAGLTAPLVHHHVTVAWFHLASHLNTFRILRYSAGDLFDYLAANGAMPEQTAVTLMCPGKTLGGYDQ